MEEQDKTLHGHMFETKTQREMSYFCWRSFPRKKRKIRQPWSEQGQGCISTSHAAYRVACTFCVLAGLSCGIPACLCLCPWGVYSVAVTALARLLLKESEVRSTYQKLYMVHGFKKIVKIVSTELRLTSTHMNDEKRI